MPRYKAFENWLYLIFLTLLYPELTQVVVKMLVGQDGPLFWLQLSKEAVRMGCARRRAGDKAVDEHDEAGAFKIQFALVGNYEIRGRGCIAAEGGVVAEYLAFDCAAQEAGEEHFGWNAVAYGPLHASSAVGHCLRDIHLAPLRVRVRHEGGDSLLDRFRIGRRIEISHG